MSSRACLFLMCVTLAFGSSLEARRTNEPRSGAAAPSVTSATLPVRFERNDGQTDPRVKFLAQGSGGTLFLTQRELVLSMGPFDGAQGRPDRRTVRIEFAGAATDAKIEGLGGVTGRSNYLIGPSPAGWRSGIPGYGRVKYTSLYPGIDLVLYGAGRHLEYDFVVSPRARPGKIRLRVEGGDISIDESGDARIATPTGTVVLSRPRIYQEVDGVRRDVAGSYRLTGRREIGFTVGRYDASKPLVIDPVLDWSTPRPRLIAQKQALARDIELCAIWKGILPVRDGLKVELHFLPTLARNKFPETTSTFQLGSATPGPVKESRHIRSNESSVCIQNYFPGCLLQLSRQNLSGGVLHHPRSRRSLG